MPSSAVRSCTLACLFMTPTLSHLPISILQLCHCYLEALWSCLIHSSAVLGVCLHHVAEDGMLSKGGQGCHTVFRQVFNALALGRVQQATIRTLLMAHSNEQDVVGQSRTTQLGSVVSLLWDCLEQLHAAGWMSLSFHAMSRTPMQHAQLKSTVSMIKRGACDGNVGLSHGKVCGNSKGALPCCQHAHLHFIAHPSLRGEEPRQQAHHRQRCLNLLGHAFHVVSQVTATHHHIAAAFHRGSHKV